MLQGVSLLSGAREPDSPMHGPCVPARRGMGLLGVTRQGSARSAVQGSPVGSGSLAASLHHPPAPQTSWGCFCEEEGFVGTGLSLQQSGPWDLR